MNTAAFMMTGLLCALLLVAPQASWAFRWDIDWLESFPLATICEGFTYIGVFFHELGHTAFAWFYGYPALPSFDMQNGGGMSYYFERALIFNFFVDLALIGGMIYFWRQWFNFALCLTALLLHLATAYNASNEIVISFMGHGAELAVASYMLWRAWLDRAEHVLGERFLNATIGFFLIFNHMILTWGLMMDAGVRGVYHFQKGAEGFGDFSKIQDALNVPDIGYIAFASFVCAVAALIVPLILFFFHAVKDAVNDESII